MRSRNFLALGLCMTLFCVLAIPGVAKADEFDQATKLTFNEPVEIPGHVLAAGTYWFTLMDSQSDRNIVRVWNEDRTQLVATILSIPDYRLEPTDKTMINFEERPADQPEAIAAWFYPGENFGHEVVYPKTRAVALAAQTQQPVLSMPDESATDTATPAPPVVNAVTDTGEEIDLNEVIASEPTSDVVMASLPQTASSLPLWGLLGLTAIGASLTLRQIRRRMDHNHQLLLAADSGQTDNRAV